MGFKDRISKNNSRKDNGTSGKKALDFGDLEVSFYKLQKGRHKIDILPYVITTDNHPDLKKGDEDYLIDYYQHFIEKDAYLCLKETFGKKCPICDEVQAIWDGDESKEDKKKKTKGLWPKRRVAYNVVDLKDQEAGIQILTASHFLFEKELLDGATDTESADEVVDFVDLEDGRSVSYKGEEASFGNSNFIRTKSFRFPERKEGYDSEVIEETFSLEKFLVIPTYKEVEASFFQIPTDDEGDGEDYEEDPLEDEAPKKKSSLKKSKPVVEDDESEDEEVEEDDEEEEAPRKKKSLKRSSTKK